MCFLCLLLFFLPSITQSVEAVLSNLKAGVKASVLGVQNIFGLIKTKASGIATTTTGAAAATTTTKVASPSTATKEKETHTAAARS
jgi:hypothetical protein